MFKNLNPRGLGFTGTIESELIELALSHGYKGMDLDIVDFSDRVASLGPQRARRLIDSAKLLIGNFSLPVSLTADDARFNTELGKLAERAKHAESLGCSRCVVLLEPASDDRPYHENFEFHRKRLTEVCKALEPAGVRLAIGFQGPAHLRKDRAFEFIHDLNATLTLVSMLPKNAGVLVDAWHLYTSGGSVEDLRKVPADKIVSVQLADAPADVAVEDCEDNQRKLPGETGAADCAGVLTILVEASYDGPVTAVPLGGRLQGIGRTSAMKAVADSLDGLWKAAGLDTDSESLAAAETA